jgi:ubiquinone/menaquinone biosynthesis C-methylase UbiE
MNISQAYNTWSSHYDTNKNKTRDLEQIALRSLLNDLSFNNCLEIGCGTGKNTGWLAQKADLVTAVDFSEKMLEKAQVKIKNKNVQFIQRDILGSWSFLEQKYDLVTFSLILEHIKDLDSILKKAAAVLITGGYVYIGELHPFKQYSGSKARFDSESGQQEVMCFTHHISEFVRAAQMNGLEFTKMEEVFDDNDKTSIPRILSLVFRKTLVL